MATEIQVSFLIFTNDDDPNSVADKLSYKPQLIWFKGNIIGKSLIKHKNSGLEYKNDMIKEIELEKEINNLVEPLWTHKDEIIKIIDSNNYETELSIVLYIDENELPILNFPNALVQKIADLRASIDIDIILI